MNPTSEGQVRFVGLCRKTIGVAKGRGSSMLVSNGRRLFKSIATVLR